jgi:hypothetical protein
MRQGRRPLATLIMMLHLETVFKGCIVPADRAETPGSFEAGSVLESHDRNNF